MISAFTPILALKQETESKEIQGCFLNNFLIYLKLKCGRVISETSSELLGLSKA